MIEFYGGYQVYTSLNSKPKILTTIYQEQADRKIP